MNKSMNVSWSKFLAMICLSSLVLFATLGFAQETTGGIQGTVKDPQGAVVSGATVEVTSPALAGGKKATTDSGGYYRFANLPPGVYDINVTAQGFGSTKQTGLKLDTAALPTVNFTLKVGGATETVEVSAEVAQVDVTSSKAITNVTNEMIAGVPKGRSFQSLIPFAPGARKEPLQDAGSGGGFQIDGASDAENAYLVEGQDTSSIRSGRSAANVPFEFVQEVVIKTSGFEAEHGGALGGVVNVIQKRGSNSWHGSVFTYYSGDKFNAAPVRALRLNPTQVFSSSTRTSEDGEYFQAKKDHYRTIEPGFEIGGPIAKDKLWFYGSYIPAINTLTRVATFNCTAPQTCVPPVSGPRKFFRDVRTHNILTRVDWLATQKIRLFGSWQNQYERASGTNLPSADSAFGQLNSSGTSNPDVFRTELGYVAPNVIYNTGADITVTPSLVLTTRYGYFYNDFQDRGKPVTGVRYVAQSSTTPNPATGLPPNDLGGAPFPAALQLTANFANIANNLNTFRDAFGRHSFTQDAAWFKRGFGGTHNFKFGYAFNRLSNNSNIAYGDSLINLFLNQSYSNTTTVGQANCSTIVAQNTTTYGAAGASGGCRGRYGYVTLRDGVELKNTVASFNHALFVQDAWTLGGGLTLNLGVRFDREDLPSFTAGAPSISFGFGQKVAPRIGASWDVFRNGKLKVYGSYGMFYDIMKYELPRGSFGGEYWHDCVFALDGPSYTALVPARDSANHNCPATTGAPGTGAYPGTRFIENVDHRVPANSPSDNRIVPGIKPMRQQEYVFGADWAISPMFALETRYARKRLDRTIEDIGILDANGENYFIGNPGEGIVKQTLASNECVGCPIQPKAIRDYDAVEFRLSKRPSARWFGQLSYTWSRLYGNYSGLASTDESGRHSPNVNRFFDLPHMQFDSHGKYNNGPLATDRPHTLKMVAFYRAKWLNMESTFGFNQQVFSGTPITTEFNVLGPPVQPEGRGNFARISRVPGAFNSTTCPTCGNLVLNGVDKGKRTPVFTQTDFNFVHEFKVSKTNEAMRLGFEANIDNLLNQKTALRVHNQVIRSGSTWEPCTPTATTCVSGIDWLKLETGWDYIARANTPSPVSRRTLDGRYGLANLFQNGRTMRFKIKFTF